MLINKKVTILVLLSQIFCISLSLSSERAAMSPSESAVIVTSVVECLRYCILHNTENEEHQKKISSMLISQQVGSHNCAPLSNLMRFLPVLQYIIFVLCIL